MPANQYVLPWETAMQYDQMVQNKKEQFQRENEEKMARIVDMEKEQQTEMGIYDRALEDHYENLHLQMGKVITKYKDPFQSIEGMREIKQVSSGYINNQFLTNAKQTQDAYQRLKQDYAQDKITTEDFKLKEAEYNDFINKGDASKTFDYARPDYTPIEKILGQTASLFDKTNLKDTRNQTVFGYSDEQFDHMADMVYVGPENRQAILKVQANMKSLGQEITPESTHSELVRLLKNQFPRKTDNRYYESDGNGSGSVSPDYLDSILGNIPNSVAANYVAMGADKSIADLSTLTFGKGQEKYSIPMRGQAKFIHSNGFDISTNTFNSRIATTKQNLANGAYEKIMNIVNNKENELPGKIFANAMPNRDLLTPAQFKKLGEKLGFSSSEIEEINNEFWSGKHKTDKALTVQGVGTLYSGDKFAEEQPRHYSANAYLYHMINKYSIVKSDIGDEDAATRAMLAQFAGNNPGQELVYVDNVNVNAHITPDMIVNRNSDAKYTASDNNARAMKLASQGISRMELAGGGNMVSFNGQDMYNGIVLQPRANPVRIGTNGFDEILSVPEALISFRNYLSFASKRGDQKIPAIQKAFKGWDAGSIQQYMNSGGNKSLNSRYNTIKGKVENGIDVTQEEKMIYEIGQEYDKLPKL